MRIWILITMLMAGCTVDDVVARRRCDAGCVDAGRADAGPDAR